MATRRKKSPAIVIGPTVAEVAAGAGLSPEAVRSRAEIGPGWDGQLRVGYDDAGRLVAEARQERELHEQKWAEFEAARAAWERKRQEVIDAAREKGMDDYARRFPMREVTFVDGEGQTHGGGANLARLSPSARQAGHEAARQAVEEFEAAEPEPVFQQ